MLLAIDSATQRISLALHNGHEVLAEQSWRSVNRHSAELPPAVARMLAQQDGALSALAVACGPGSFSGLRIGVAFAKGLAAARALPLVGITTQDILAAAQPPCPGHALLILLAAGRSRVIAARYRWCAERWHAEDEAKLLTLDELVQSLLTPTVIAGELDAAGQATLLRAQQNGVLLQLAPAARSLRRAGFLAQLALERLRSGEAQDFAPELVTAHYIATRDTP